MNAFYQKVALITGAASGIGRELARQLGRHGAIVIATDINEEGVEALVDSIRQDGGKADYYRLDVTDYHAVRQLVSYLVSSYGRLDYAFCNAGIGVGGETRDIPVEAWDRVLGVNLNGVVYTATEAYKAMVKQGSGHIINTASLAGLVYSGTLTPYVTTKHAVVAFSRCLRLEGKELGVNVTAFCPGFLDTGIYDSSLLYGITHEEAMKVKPFGIHPVEGAVEQLLKGVAANQELVVLPFYAKMMSWLTRFAGPVARLLTNTELKRMRQIRRVPITKEETA